MSQNSLCWRMKVPKIFKYVSGILSIIKIINSHLQLLILMRIFPVLAKRLANSLLLTTQNYRSLQHTLKFSFSQDNNSILIDRGTLTVRNSETFELKLQKVNPANRAISPVNLQFTTLSTLNDLAIQFKSQFGIEEVNIYCEDGTLISKHTPVDALLNQTFVIMSEDYRIKVEGQFLHAQQDSNIKISELKDNLRQLELPVLAQRQIQNYMKRVDIWLQAKYYGGQKNNKNKIKTKDIQDILVQSIVDPEHRWKLMAQIQQEWEAKYWQVIELRQKKQEAELMSLRMARRRMLMGMGILVANTAFIWSGTFFIWSWDIIEPIAYFMSSAGAITLFAQTLKLKKPFSLQNYLGYLSEKHLQAACKKVGVDLQELRSKQLQLQVLECTLKDYLIVKL